MAHISRGPIGASPMSVEDVLAAADRAMYQQKAARKLAGPTLS